MFEGGKVAIIGEAGLCFAFKAAGFVVFSPADIEELRAVMKTIEKEQYALCFLHESFFEQLEEERKELAKKLYPVIVGFSDYRKVADPMERMLKEMTVRATGSDSLVKRKGKT